MRRREVYGLLAMMKSLRTASAALLLLVSWQPSISAELPPELRSGSSVVGKAGPSVDLYRHAGLVGSRVRIDLETPGDAIITLYSPRGEEMLSSAGNGRVELEAVLPLTNHFLIGISRKESAKPYKLKLSVAEPDLHEMLNAWTVGFASTRKDKATGEAYLVKSCWVDPGRTLRRIYPKGTEEITIGRDGIEYGKLFINGKHARDVQRQLRFEGTTAVVPRQVGGKWEDTRFELDKLTDVTGLGPYERYRCL